MDLRHQRGATCIYQQFRQVKLLHLILVLTVILFIMPLLAHYYLSKIGGENPETPALGQKSLLQHPHAEDTFHSRNMKAHIDELVRIKTSVNNELRELESKRQKLQSQIAKYHTELEKTRSEKEIIDKEIKMTQLTLDQLKLEREELDQKYIPLLKAPKQILAGPESYVNMTAPSNPTICRMHNCFDFSACSLLSGFPVYVYSKNHLTDLGLLDPFIDASVWEVLDNTPYKTLNPKSACVYIVIVGQRDKEELDSDVLEKSLKNLPYWRGDGRNHILVNILRRPGNADMFMGIKTGRSIIAQTAFMDTPYRYKFDILIPPNLGKASGEVWEELPPISPIRRKFFLSFVGNYKGSLSVPKEALRMSSKHLEELKDNNHRNMMDNGINSKDDADLNYHYQNRNLRSIQEGASSTMTMSEIDFDVSVIQYLKELGANVDSGVVCQFACDSPIEGAINGEWSLCGTAAERRDLLEQSTFSLLIAPANSSYVSTSVFQIRLFDSLKNGAVPVILGDYVELPYGDIIDWKKAAITLPKARISEIHFLLRTYTDSDIAFLRRQGRFFYETYFGSTSSILNSVLALVRTRLNIPATAVKDVESNSVFNSSFSLLKLDGQEPNPETDEVLGPLEPPLSSVFYKHNFTQFVSNQMFQHVGDPFKMFPATPFEKVLPSDAKFWGSGYGFRPIGRGVGGAGKEFSESLGGNLPREQFTIVMLTYERESVLISALQRLKGLPFLNKVLVVWNNPIPPSQDLRWPEIHVPIKVLRMTKNSLNNRFLPFDAIETEAVLSIDDDAHLRHDEIVFGFRVWREEREKIVGFPGRFHAWDASSHAWLYNSNYSCELSMVLTGAAFFHKYYMYLYTYTMPQAIRDKVDEFINCEDIAMNFLVSHVTRKPPIKVTSRWTFRCPGCPVTLSNDSSHFEERHKCINYFVRVYGYMPLLYTQYRVDSVLFKTRLPRDKLKCFKFI